MSNLDVAVRVRLINQLRGPANQAKQDLEGVEKAARKLNGARGGEKIVRDQKAAAREAARTKRELTDVERAARRLNGARGGERLGRDLKGVTGEAKRADEALKRLDQTSRRLGAGHKPGLGIKPGSGVRAGLAEGAQEVGSRSGLPPIALGAGGMGVAGGAAALGILGVSAAIGGAVSEAMSFEDAMAEVRKAVSMSDTEFGALRQTILRLSRETPLAKEELALLVAQAGFAGRPVKDLARFATFAAKAAVAFGLGAEDAGDRLAKLGNVFQLTQDGIEALGDSINVLGDNTAAKESDIIDFLTRVGTTARGFGLAEHQTAAFGAALLSLGVAPEVAANGFGTLLTRLQTSTKQGKEFQGGLKALGLSAKEVQKLIAKGPAEALVEIFTRLDKLDPAKRAGVLVDMFGLEYADDAGRMAGAIKQIQQALDLIRDPSSYRGNVESTFTIFDELTSSKLTKLGNQFKSLGANIGKWLTPAIGGAADAASSLLDRINAAFDRAAQVKAMADKTAKGEDLAPEEKAKLAADPSMKQDVARAAAAQDHPVIGLVQQLMELEKELASVQGRAGKGGVMAQSQLANVQAQINQVRSEIEAAMKLPGAAEAVSQSMAAVAKAVGSEGEQAVQQAQQIAERIKALFNFTATPTISPRFGPAGGATFKDGTPVPTPPSRPPQKQGAAGGARAFAQTNHITIQGASDPAATGRAVAQKLAQLGNGSSNLFDPVG